MRVEIDEFPDTLPLAQDCFDLPNGGGQRLDSESCPVWAEADEIRYQLREEID